MDKTPLENTVDARANLIAMSILSRLIDCERT
jgi:hypothetical protein